MTNPLISVVITCYNRKEYIEHCVDSVLDSSFEDFEIIIVDDNSTDNTPQILRNKYLNHDKIRMFFNSQNLGQFENRNYAASLATGEYIKFLDSDDMIYRHGLGVMLEMLEQFPNAGAAISHDTLNEALPYPMFLDAWDAYSSFYFNKGFPKSGPSASIIKRDIFNRVGGYKEPFYVGSDIFFWLDIASISGIVKLPPSLIWYRQHPGQELQKGVCSQEYLRNDYNYFRKYLEKPNVPFDDKEIKEALAFQKCNYIKALLRFIKITGKLRIALGYYRNSGLKLSDMKDVFYRL